LRKDGGRREEGKKGPPSLSLQCNREGKRELRVNFAFLLAPFGRGKRREEERKKR